MKVEVTVEGIQAATQRVRRFSRVNRHLDGMNRRRAVKYQSLVKSRAPVDTGLYRSGIRVSRVATLSTHGWSVVSDAPQTRRLEFGFVGIDSMGRVYNQAPQAHWRPALLEMEDFDRKEARKTIERIWNDQA